ncbi:endolytic transglycosylase MltG [Candidatus Gracilibacteria bacterium]|nr:endolytic transglycosylase MltG [Candidatus Gracilibacteria bacterium]
MKKILLLAVLFLGLYFSARVLLVWDKPNSEDVTRVSLEIVPGTSVKRIAFLLKEKDLILDDFVFRVFVKLNGLESKLQAGDYILQKNLTLSEITDILQHGKSQEMKITIPEGSTIDQIDEILTKKSLIEAGDFKKCTATCDLGFSISTLEGYLFPSTYFINTNNFSSKKFIQRLYRNFNVQIADFRIDIQKNGRTLEEIVIVASMIEREAFGDSYEEKQKIANVIWKRLDERMYLGIDATTRYELGDWKRPLYTEDFESNSPYNTRRKLGLPPTAISNPGVLSLKSAIYPQETPYYYYLHDRNGGVHFGKTLQEHNENKLKYLY